MKTIESQEEVVEQVNRCLSTVQLTGATMMVVPEAVRREDDWWYVPVRPSVEPAKRLEYYEALAEIESRLQEQLELRIVLIPVAPPEPVER